MTHETKAILNMLEKEEDLKFDLLDRITVRHLEDEEVFREAIIDLAFLLEDEIRSSAGHHFIDSSMWGDIVMPYIKEADYKEISELWLSRTRESRLRMQEKKNA